MLCLPLLINQSEADMKISQERFKFLQIIRNLITTRHSDYRTRTSEPVKFLA